MSLVIALKTVRPPFLVLTPVCVFLGLSTAYASQSPLDPATLLLVLVGALSAHISVNTLNEYRDFRSGLDLKTQKTGFSGGSGALPRHPQLAGTVLRISLTSLLVTVVIGAYFILQNGVQILPIGLLGVVLVMAYTPWINRSPYLCLIAPGLGFGVLMVVGTHLLLDGEHSRLPWLLSLVPFFLVNNLLLLNQYPDIEADSSVGRNTFPIVFGPSASSLVYALFALAAYSLVLAFVVRGDLPMIGLVALLPMAFSIFSLSGAIKHAANIGCYPRYLGANVAAAILTPSLLGIAIVHG